MGKVLYGVKLIGFDNIVKKIELFLDSSQLDEYISSCKFVGRFEKIALEYFTDLYGRADVLKVKNLMNYEISYYCHEGAYAYCKYENKIWMRYRDGDQYPKVYYEALWNYGFRTFYNPYILTNIYQKEIIKKLNMIKSDE